VHDDDYDAVHIASPDHPGEQHQPVRDDLRLARVLTQQRRKYSERRI